MSPGGSSGAGGFGAPVASGSREGAGLYVPAPERLSDGAPSSPGARMDPAGLQASDTRATANATAAERPALGSDHLGMTLCR